MAKDTPKKDSHEALLKQLKNPFDPRLVKWRVGGGGKSLAYIDARDVMKRLDDVLGADRYQTKYVPIDGGFVCELSIKFGDEWITRSDGANNTKVEPVKGGISSALKRAANAWGIGRYLYYLDPAKFSARNIDQWPKWALPNNDIEKWEDIAEMEVDSDFGMDDTEEIVTNALNIADKIRNAKTKEELKEVIKTMDADTQRFFADAIVTKTEELLGGNTDNS